MAAAALIGLANSPAAGADTGPFKDLFGDSGINTWTPAADASLDTNDPTLAADLAASVEDFQTGFVPGYSAVFGSVSFSLLADHFDPSAFSDNLGVLIPNDALGDLAVGLDYTLFATGLGSLDADVLILLGPLLLGSI